MGTDKIYNVGIIGYGSMASNHQKQLSKGNVRARLKGVFDTDPDRMQLASEQGYITYSSKDELLSDPEIDIVLISTTNESHCGVALDALAAGKHIICEKPVTITSKELERIIDAADEAGKVFTIDQNRRFNRDFLNMCDGIEKGLIGKPYVIESRVEGSRGMPEGWRTKKAQGGGMMYDWGVHLIDQILYFVKDEVTNVFCKMYSIRYNEVDDNFRLTITFKTGLTAHIEVSTNNFITHPRFYVLGTEGTMVITDWDGTGRVVRRLSDDNEWENGITKVKAGPTKTMAPRDPKTQEEITLSPLSDVNDNLDPVYRQLIDAIEGKELLIKPREALRVMKVMEAAFESARNSQAISCNI